MAVSKEQYGPPSKPGCAGTATGLVVGFDGVLYNAGDLAATLALVRASGTSVTDPVPLLAAGYRRWGEGLASRLDGDFALVIWDPDQQLVYAACDSAGVRPLYFAYEAGVHFSFASEASALGDLLGLDVKIPESRLVEQLVPALEMLEYEEPLVRGVRRLPAAHACVASARRIQLAECWAPGRIASPGLRENDLTGWVEGFGWHLQRAVQKRVMRAMQPGVMFSGGLDSSSVLALAQQQQARVGILTFSLVDSGDPGCPETLAIERMNRHCHATPTQIDVADCADAATQALGIIGAAPRYLSGRAAFLHLCYARAAAHGVDVMMDGLDADSLLSHGGIGESLLRQGRFRDFHRAARNYAQLRDGRTSDEFGMARGFLKLVLPRGLRRRVASLRNELTSAKWLAGSLLNRATVARFELKAGLASLDATSALPDGIHDQRLKSSMGSMVIRDGIARTHARAAQHGVQLRHPFMDKALMDFCAWLPLEMRLRDGWTKWVMRQAMDAHLPHEIAWRRDKTHIGAKFDRIVLQPVLDRLMRDLPRAAAGVQAYVDRDAVLDLGRQWQRGEISAVWRLTPILLLEHWLQCNPEKVDWGR